MDSDQSEDDSAAPFPEEESRMWEVSSDSSDSSVEMQQSLVPLPPVPARRGRTSGATSGRRTHRQKELRKEENLLNNMLPGLHAGRLTTLKCRIPPDVSSPRLVECSNCKADDHAMLWKCKECSVLQHVAPTLFCSACFGLVHVNQPHCAFVWVEGETLFRPPRAEETTIFPIRPVCLACDEVCHIVGAQPALRNVILLSPSGPFFCDIPQGPVICSNCAQPVDPPTPPELGCTPCNATFESSCCAWVTKPLQSLVMALRAEGCVSVNALSRSLLKAWRSGGSFLLKESPTSPFPAVVDTPYLERRLQQAISTEVLLAHPSWMDPNPVFKLLDAMSSRCSACVAECSNVHVDGFFKMKQMKRPLTLRPPKLQFFCNISEQEAEGFKQADLEDSNTNNAVCSDVSGNVTHFRSGSSTAGGKQSYSQTGVIIAVCAHGVPLRLLPMTTKGEKFYLPHAVISSLVNSDYPREVNFISYDVACLMRAYLQARDPNLSSAVDGKLVLGHFHAKSHKCRHHNVSWSREGAGLDDGEQGERWNSTMVGHAPSMRYMRQERQRELLEHIMLEATRLVNNHLGGILLRRFEHAHKALGKHHAALLMQITSLEERLSNHNFVASQDQIEHWTAEHVAPPSADIPSAHADSDITEKEMDYVRCHQEWHSVAAAESIADYLSQQQALKSVEHPTDFQTARLKYVNSAITAHNRLSRASTEVSAAGFCLVLFLRLFGSFRLSSVG